MAQDKTEAGAAKRPSKKGADRASRDPALAAYKTFLEQSKDRKTLENSLLIALLTFFVLLFITFPEIVAGLMEKAEEEDQIEEVPQQKIIEKKEEPPPEVEERFRQEKKEHSFSIPSVTSPTASDVILPPAERTETLDVTDADLDSVGFDEDIPDSTPWIVVAGPIEKPVFVAGGPRIYPQRARMLKKEGYARLEVKISRNGETVSIELLEEQPADFGFGEAAIKYFEQGKWKPARQNGKPIDAIYRFKFDYTLTTAR